jgi:hypothetical protein
MEGHRLSEDSVLSLLSNFTDQGPKDRNELHRLLREARTAVDDLVKGIAVKGSNPVTVDNILHALMQQAPNEHGQRYVSHVILKYKDFEDRREQKKFLVMLAETWLTYLLYPGIAPSPL